ncbi:MAG TPA: efflux RND transporter periplasmic adaptor subunit [Polyangia bacterium]|nr:efflux RND transporter periplasmic adaptor subunit [Polyangia bacterium]
MAVAGCTASAASKAPPRPPAMPVQIATVGTAPLRDATEYVAILRPRQSVRVLPQIDGYVTRILVAPGARVSRGTALMQIDPSRQQATVRAQRAARDASRATLAYWRRQTKRVEKLFAGGAATRADVDQAENQLEQAEASAASSEAQVQAASIQLGYFKVTAPAEGTVGDIPVKLGDLVNPQTLLTTLDDNDVLETLLDVPLERAPTLKVGTPLEIVDAAGRTLAPSRVSFVSPRADPATQTVLVKAVIDNRDGHLRSAQFARARVIWSRREGPVVPVLAVQSRAGQSFVWAVREHAGQGLVAELQPVRVGQVEGQTFAVLAGLRVGDRIVVSGVQKLRPGAPVTPLAPGPGGGPSAPGG